MTSPARKLNLNVGINTTGYLPNAWKYRTGTRHDINDPDYYRRLTELAHKGLFDAVFFSDHPALMTDPNSRPFHTIDPLILCSALAAQVPDIGFVATMSSTYNSPFNLARRTQSADIISGGRMIVNIVSSFNPNVAANFGSTPLPPRSERYAKASEFLDVAKKLWASWDPARENEVPDNLFWDAASAHAIDHTGDYFNVKGPLNVPRGPQGHPVLAQAGASEGGIDLAARHGEIIYCNILSRPAGQAFGKKVKDRAAALGRDPSGIRIVPGLVVILGDSRDEALRKHELFSGAGSEDGLIARFVRDNGIDPDGFNPDAVLEAERFIPDQNRLLAVGMGLGLADLLTHEKLTARQAVRRSEGHHRLLLGTPEEVADGIIDLWADGTVDGYTLQPPRAPDDIEEFVEKVVPILQDRGVYRTAYEGKTVRDRYGLPYPA
ncbi:NtaA/DmoA family FMN-dependent monooxygenase [Rhizobium bangladeshense]|uniref:NtaA/DmoA family FMN-dependent monooxygenase n=1 Tax=Rhizobium bangladeshense TaxID=1138189 RepID=UPI001C8330F6|nr:NtaA/DmoA family FMN-dependent monooxygenase [Rhizobium bangladeshense]MBX4901184.1 NtaA/DmoA family FMN-dependent monooxygenase [Rhizobium bangladeshense]MBX4915272.1 NtaA/DmoA family FMN-dependent monooxygenase [Rhizobium bangladeshense]MBX4922224.1 NtaA/DmoA family FMN-dependent monooxygenase [Rhizobium bangladeshense]MBY3599425.1 NtaA/DmoA family FMN-dependent monooxygenase [Rhizobium bangladeshense]